MTPAELICTILTVAFFVGGFPLLAYMRWQTHKDRAMAERFRRGT